MAGLPNPSAARDPEIFDEIEAELGVSPVALETRLKISTLEQALGQSPASSRIGPC